MKGKIFSICLTLLAIEASVFYIINARVQFVALMVCILVIEILLSMVRERGDLGGKCVLAEISVFCTMPLLMYIREVSGGTNLTVNVIVTVTLCYITCRVTMKKRYSVAAGIAISATVAALTQLYFAVFVVAFIIGIPLCVSNPKTAKKV